MNVIHSIAQWFHHNSIYGDRRYVYSGSLNSLSPFCDRMYLIKRYFHRLWIWQYFRRSVFLQKYDASIICEMGRHRAELWCILARFNSARNTMGLCLALIQKWYYYVVHIISLPKRNLILKFSAELMNSRFSHILNCTTKLIRL